MTLDRGDRRGEAPMKPTRRKLFRLIASAAALPALPRPAHAQTYPSRPVHCIVG